MPSSFVCQAKQILLTYSQTNDAFNEELRQRANAHYDFVAQALRPPVLYRLARERHNDGGLHFHCFIAWDAACPIRSQSRLDYNGSHPNIKPIRGNPKRAWEYTGKDGDIVFQHGELDDDLNDNRSTNDSVWSAAVRAETKDKFFEIVRECAPRYYVLYSAQLEYYAAKNYTDPKEDYTGPAFTDLSRDRFEQWRLQAGIGASPTGRPKSLIIWGESRTGKTIWARSLGMLRSSLIPILGRHSYFQGHFNLDEYDDDCEYAIFDDIAGNFKYFPNYKGWLGCQKTITVTDKYKPKRKINWGRPCILLCNDDPGSDPCVDYNWLEANCFIVNVPEYDPIASVP
uniref:Replication-associated protein n=1 Tax=Genomoviridae sp. TaxID=2202565 RepID=A0A8F5RCE3_9VIRU|nr:MAG: replication associated protein [Genomoviridae sp.]